MRHPTNLWTLLASTSLSLSFFFNLWFASIGVAHGLQLAILAFSKSNTYFLWERKIPCFDLTMLRKYFKEPKSLISNSFAKLPFKKITSTSSFHVTIISSTYTIKAISLGPCLLINRVWSNYAYLCLDFIIAGSKSFKLCTW